MSEQTVFRFLQISDTLFDSAGALKSLELSPVKRKERTEEGFIALEKALALAQEEEVNAVFIAGNLFHAETVTTTTISRLQTAFAKLRQIPIVVAPGEHDSLTTDSMYHQHSVEALGLNRWPPNVYVFIKNEWATIKLPACPGVSITCRPAVDKIAPEVDAAKFAALRKDDSKIKLLIRPMPSAHQVRSGKNELQLPQAEEIEKFGFTYAAFSGFASCRMVNGASGRPIGGCSGTLFGQTEFEPGPRYALDCSFTATPSQIEAKIEPREFDQRRIVVAAVDLGTVSPDLRAEKLRSALNRANARDQDIVIFKLVGTYAANLPPEINLEEFRKRFYHVKFQDLSRPDYLIASATHTATERRFLELISETRTSLSNASEHTDDVIEDALYFGLSALREGRIIIRDAD